MHSRQIMWPTKHFGAISIVVDPWGNSQDYGVADQDLVAMDVQVRNVGIFPVIVRLITSITTLKS